ncbi:TetR/AcrR family transcriptional regulator [Nocardia sp. NBC_01009]|uniref:TetR/AcrR family transcriptional regulator n=1 Tax=Nocardia sp. NBC_01009 TaxID=2975996 RepID=UPI0038705B93|nr:TetR/AcrR family transcriptional regulator [Nocardia sp. NBC_01009]
MTVTMKRSDATKQALLRAARDEFAEYGLAGGRVDRIAEAAGVNKERIYGLFGSKDKLFDVILIDTLREFIDVVQPMADTEPGDYVGKLFDYHRDNPQLLRLLLWESLHRGADAHDIDGWRAEHYVQKFDRAREQFGVDEQQAGLVLLALCGVANWTYAVPQTTRLLLGAAAEDYETTKRFMQEFARAAMRREPRDDSSVNELTTRTAAAAPTGTLRTAATETPVEAIAGANDNAAAEPPAHTGPENSCDNVDRAAQRLRDAQAAAEAARDELAEALRAAHAAGAGANQLARRVAGTLSRPVVLKLLAD